MDKHREAQRLFHQEKNIINRKFVRNKKKHLFWKRMRQLKRLWVYRCINNTVQQKGLWRNKFPKTKIFEIDWRHRCHFHLLKIINSFKSFQEIKIIQSISSCRSFKCLFMFPSKTYVRCNVNIIVVAIFLFSLHVLPYFVFLVVFTYLLNSLWFYNVGL